MTRVVGIWDVWARDVIATLSGTASAHELVVDWVIEQREQTGTVWVLLDEWTDAPLPERFDAVFEVVELSDDAGVWAVLGGSRAKGLTADEGPNG